MTQTGEIRDEVSYQAALSRMQEIDRRTDQLNEAIQSGTATDENRAELQQLQDERTGLNQRIGTYLQNHGRPMQQSLPSAPGPWQPPPAVPSTESPSGPPPNPTPAQGGKSMRLRLWNLMLAVFAIIGLIVVIFWTAYVWPGPQLQNWWQTEVEPNMPCFMVEKGGTCDATTNPSDGSGTETIEPDFGVTYSPPPGSGSTWICDKDSQIGKTPDGDPIYDEPCPDPPA